MGGLPDIELWLLFVPFVRLGEPDRETTLARMLVASVGDALLVWPELYE